mmetsp:Transcript_1087/g.7006  ORF Transcript_1087/g.7006 Transcript_1087/m.7006 type:complete len:211 (-) Transcript_1087:103-735(-)
MQVSQDGDFHFLLPFVPAGVLSRLVFWRRPSICFLEPPFEGDGSVGILPFFLRPSEFETSPYFVLCPKLQPRGPSKAHVLGGHVGPRLVSSHLHHHAVFRCDPLPVHVHGRLSRTHQQLQRARHRPERFHVGVSEAHHQCVHGQCRTPSVFSWFFFVRTRPQALLLPFWMSAISPETRLARAAVVCATRACVHRVRRTSPISSVEILPPS